MALPSGYSIERARREDADAIRRFFDAHWRKDHIFARDSDFFAYEMMPDGPPNFLLAWFGGEIVGQIGFIAPMPGDAQADLVITTLRVLDAHSKAGLSVALVQAVMAMTQGATHCVGIVAKALPLYTLLGFRTGRMDHGWWPNPAITQRRISVASSPRPAPVARPDAIARRIERMDGVRLTGAGEAAQLPKSRAFLERRYFRHPHYRYIPILIGDSSGREHGLGVLRRAEANGASALRIVDWLGDPAWFGAFVASAAALCVRTGAEYVDCYSANLDGDILREAGLLPPEDDEIAPNYFSPFELRNVTLTYATTASPAKYLFRGDGDQDRPS